ncbi:polymorphic toxin type 50 domain-containing protein [Bacillus haynesii]|nr:polymorphic toxin type 50 domain-containing protein [Bacillus haynesii]MCY8370446.1 polymorphic toxin type 50 domain-containing protein [Bacillus haynesii]MEC1450924.1 polymorphic toxin type 50 domain-containing protein [Bacillus haynesii]MEC1455696.1 polymorphic toxin type 50 domain-containing protein [Bacillus haynesii]
MAEPRVSSMGIIKKLKSCLINMLARENSQGREVVDFGQKIGKAYDMKTGKYIETTRGTIHYSKDGAHIVPAKPLEP